MFVIHSPMKRDFIVEALGTQKAKERIRLVSQLAANMHSIHQKQMVVVLHQELSLEQIISFGLIRGIKETFSELLVEFPMIDYAFENLTLFGFENGQVMSHNSYFDEPVKLANYLRCELGTSRIGTVLDTCHMLSSIRVNEMLSHYGPINQPTIKDFMWAYKDTLKLIHLANAIGLGIGKDHGATFSTLEDVSVLKEILSYVEEINFECPITLEIVEKNHAVASGYSEMKDILKSLNISNF